MTWTPDLVLHRLIDACRVVEAITSRAGPKSFGNSMPTPLILASDIERYRFELDDILTNQGKATARMKADRHHEIEKNAARAASAEAISMAYEALRWPVQFIPDEAKRAAILAFAACRARDGDWSRAVERRNKRHANEKRWSKRTTYRWNEQSLQRIADGLLKESVLLRLPAGLQMAHETAETACELDKMGSLAWMAPDAKPLLNVERNIPAPRTNRKAA